MYVNHIFSYSMLLKIIETNFERNQHILWNIFQKFFDDFELISGFTHNNKDFFLLNGILSKMLTFLFFITEIYVNFNRFYLNFNEFKPDFERFEHNV
jgi:hypothetical protein